MLKLKLVPKDLVTITIRTTFDTHLGFSLPVSLPDWPPQGSWLGHWSSSDFNVQKGTHPSDLSASIVSP